MPGPPPKDPAIRQRTNKSSTRALLTDNPERKIRKPSLFKRLDADGKIIAWHEMTRRWWRDVWRSPMAGEYLQADHHGLYRLAELVNLFWCEPSAGLAAEIRLQQQSFGLTPLDRRRLEWTVEQAEGAKDRGKKREQPERPAATGEDPRKMLTMVK